MEAVPQIVEAAMGPMGLRHVWPFVWAPMAGVGKHMLVVVVSMCGHCAMHLVAHWQLVLVC